MSKQSLYNKIVTLNTLAPFPIKKLELRPSASN